MPGGGMRITIAAVTPRKQRMKSGPAQELVRDYVARCGRYATTELSFFETEEAVLAAVEKASGRSLPCFVAMDSAGKSMGSREIAGWVEKIRDGGTQELVFAVGPADGWSAEAKARARLVLSLGAVTLSHELALVVVAEQVYRALTILAGHPYHAGH